jgi:hypothetical protein
VLERLLARLDADRPAELEPLGGRGGARYYFRRPPPAGCGPRAPLECGRAVLCDVSATGAGLLIGAEFPPGTVLVLQLPTGDLAVTTMHQARLVHATPQAPGLWLIGCQFVHRLTEPQLRGVLAAGRTTPALPAP